MISVYRTATGDLVVGLPGEGDLLRYVTRSFLGGLIDTEVYILEAKTPVSRDDPAWAPAVEIWQQRWLKTLYERERLAETAYCKAHDAYREVRNAI